MRKCAKSSITNGISSKRPRTVFFNGLLRYNLHTIYSFKVYNSIVFSILIKLCNSHCNLSLELLYHPQRNPIPTGSHSSSLSSSYYRQLLICFLSLYICLFCTFSINEIILQWSFVSGFFHLAYVFKVHPCWQHVSVLYFFLLPNCVPLYGYATFCLIHSSGDEHLHFYCSAIVIKLLEILM